MSAASVHELVSRSAQRGGDGLAIVDRDRSITYAELELRSNQLAHALIELGVSPGDRVGLFLEKSLEALIGVYGVLKAGAAYVPFDEQAPISRLAYIAANAEITCLVSSAAKAGDWERLVAEGAPLRSVIAANSSADQVPSPLQVISFAQLDSFSSDPPGVRTGDDTLAYILYTSGSTGVPKGVMLSHRNALAFVEWAAAAVGVNASDRLSSHAPLHFDLSTFDLFGAACGGAPVVLVPREKSVFPVELHRFIEEAAITVWYSVPSILTMLALRGGLEHSVPRALRTVLFAGEVFPTKHLARLMTLLPDARFYNLYGPTETNVCTWYEVPRPAESLRDPIPIGWPIDGVTLLIEDENQRPAHRGEWGELAVRGPTVMHGYWGDEARTAQMLRRLPDGTREYRTGDLVRLASDGTHEFAGRRDAQVKTRGYRVELGEIEVALNAYDGVVECAVVAIPDDVATNRLKAFVVAADGVTAGELIRHCREKLPRYMVPDEFELRSELPKSSTGKIDRRRLATSTGP